MKPLSFKLLAQSELSRIAAAAGEAIGRWSSAWFGSAEAGGVEVRAAAPAGAERAAPIAIARAPIVMARAADDSRWVAVLAGEGLYRAAAARLAAHAGDTWTARGELPPVLRGALEECFAALADEMLAAARVQGAARVPARDAQAGSSLDEAGRRGSGAAEVLCDLGGERFVTVLSAAVVSELIGRTRPSPRGGLARRMDCIQQRKVGLRVVAGGADLAIGSLLSAAPGDVIVLDARIDQTFALAGADGAPVGHGFLGSSVGAKALQLVSQ